MASNQTLLRFVRRQRGISQQALADAAGISHSYLSDVERCKYTPSEDVTNRLADALHVPAARLYEEPRV